MKHLLLTTLAAASTALLPAQTVLVDFESAETTTSFFYFGNVDLSDSEANVIDNPDMSGANTSAKVVEFVERAGAEVWAGFYPNPLPAAKADFTSNTQVCVDVWMPEISSVALKLEKGNDGAPDWVRSKANTKVNEWEQICIDVALPSEEGDLSPATGRVYDQVTLFPALGASPTEDKTYYFDNFLVQGGTQSTEDVTFAVDMSEYEGDFTTVYVSGSFNAWSGDANPLSDDDMDGVWTGTVSMLTGAYEYKFQLDQWTAQEEFAGGEECTKTTDNDDGRFVNRALTVSGPTTLDAVCFASCYACGESVSITFNLGASGNPVSEEGLYLAGGAAFGAPGAYRLTDDDDNGVYSITIERERGFGSYYTFTNGACGDFSCKEDLTGLECGDPASFNDRLIANVQSDTVINACFGSCETDLEACSVPPVTYDVMVAVDMNEYGGDFETAYISGSFNGWEGGANPLSDDDMDGVWTGTINVAAGTYQYKFQLDQWTTQEEFAGGESCTIEDGGFVNRVVTITEAMSMDAVCYASCDACDASNVGELAAIGVDFTVAPTVAVDEVRIGFGTALEDATLRVYDVTGKTVRTARLQNVSQHRLDVSDLEAGYYLVELEYAGARGVRRVVKQ